MTHAAVVYPNRPPMDYCMVPINRPTEQGGFNVQSRRVQLGWWRICGRTGVKHAPNGGTGVPNPQPEQRWVMQPNISLDGLHLETDVL